MDISVLTFEAYDPAGPTVRLVRVATAGFTTRPSETPPNAYHDGRLLVPAAVKRDAFDTGTLGGRSRYGIGDATIANGDRRYDWLLEAGVDGRYAEERRGPLGGVFPTDFPITFLGTAEQVIGERGSDGAPVLTIKLRDGQAVFDVPLQPTKYAGTNVPPNGVEGTVADLQGKPKMIVDGAPRNVTPDLVNAPKLIYQCGDGPLAGIPAVYDDGIPLFTGFPFTQRTTGFPGASAGIYASCVGRGVMLIGGDGGRLERSTDGGATWTPVTSGFGGDLIRALHDTGTVFVAVGANGKLSTSPDGVTWTLQTTASFGSGTIAAITSTATSILAVGATGGGGAAGHLERSVDGGVTWVAHTTGFGASGIAGIASGFGRLVIVGGAGAVASSEDDGLTWALGTLNVGTVTMNAVAAGTLGFVAVGNAGTVSTSPTGLAWTKRDPGIPVAAALQTAIAGNGCYLIAGTSSLLLQSFDLRSWIVQPSGFSAGSIIATLAFGDTTFLAGDIANYEVATSPEVAFYASAADLEDDTLAPAPGTYKVYLAGAQFRLGAPASGTVTADPVQGATPADRTHGQMFARTVARLGKTVAPADIIALDLADSSPAGCRVKDEMQASALLDQIAQSCGAWWGADLTGTIRIQPFTAPSGSPVASFGRQHILEFSWLAPSDGLRGLPRVRTIKRWGRNYTVQSTVAAGVDVARQADLAREWREAVSEDLSVLSIHLLAQQVDSDSLYTTAAGAQAAADREQALFGVQRRRARVTVALTPQVDALDLFPVIRLTLADYGLSAGRLFRVIGFDPDRQRQRMTMTVFA
ncbi:MAG: hypothetical protein JWM95_751 [Gemmatimonadetes bacterium]|nr:hypothetical protein [Gemmatimonadota bacterium]